MRTLQPEVGHRRAEQGAVEVDPDGEALVHPEEFGGGAAAHGMSDDADPAGVRPGPGPPPTTGQGRGDEPQVTDAHTYFEAFLAVPVVRFLGQHAVDGPAVGELHHRSV